MMKTNFFMLLLSFLLMAPLKVNAQITPKTSASSPTTAQLVKKAETYAEDGEYLEAAKVYKRIVNRGNKKYSYNVARMYQCRFLGDVYGVSTAVIQED